MQSGWLELATGCVTVEVTGDKATIRSYLAPDNSQDNWHYYGTCYLERGTHKFDFKGGYWVIEGDNNSKITDIRDTGGGCGFKCLNMH